MNDSGFFLLVWYLFIAPFWIAWKIIRLLWEFVVKPLNQKLADKNAEKYQEQHDALTAPQREAREAARNAQLDALKVALPKTPPERMRATIQVNPIKVADQDQRRISRVVADDSLIWVDGQERTEYAVDMILELSETERAIIKQQRLEDSVFEDEPVHSAESLAQIARHDGERAAAFKDPEAARLWDEGSSEMMKYVKSLRARTTLGDYLVTPYTKCFPTLQQANQYASVLKTKILPQIKSLLEQHQTEKPPQTIQF